MSNVDLSAIIPYLMIAMAIFAELSTNREIEQKLNVTFPKLKRIYHVLLFLVISIVWPIFLAVKKALEKKK